MHIQSELHGQLARERIEREIAARPRLLRRAASSSTSIRQAVGHRIIRIGAAARRGTLTRARLGPAEGPGQLPHHGDHSRDHRRP